MQSACNSELPAGLLPACDWLLHPDPLQHGRPSRRRGGPRFHGRHEGTTAVTANPVSQPGCPFARSSTNVQGFRLGIVVRSGSEMTP